MGAGPGYTTLKEIPNFGPSNFITDRTGHPFSGIPMIYNSYPNGGYNGNLPLSGIEIRGLTLDGQGTNQNTSYLLWGIYLNDVVGSIIDDVVAQNMLQHGILLKNAVRTITSNFLVQNNGLNLTTWGDGFDLLAACQDNVVMNGIAYNNSGEGFESEGRFGSYVAVNRNMRNKWVNLLAVYNQGDGWLEMWSDYDNFTDCTGIGNARTGTNSADFKILGSTFVTLTNLRSQNSYYSGLWISPETYGANGVSNHIVVRNATVIDAAASAFPVRVDYGVDRWAIRPSRTVPSKSECGASREPTRSASGRTRPTSRSR